MKPDWETTMKPIIKIALALAALPLLSLQAAHAQTGNPPAPDKCKVDPAPPLQGESQPTDPSTTESLTDKLDDCNAVLAPPPVGDGEIVTPPPNVGTTPVIRPEEVPPQSGSDPQ